MIDNKAFETKLNIILSELFNEKIGLQSISETRRGRGRPDIMIFLGGLKMIIEGSYSKTDAENDVRSKVEKGFADIGIALHYREMIGDFDEVRVKKILQSSKFNAKIFIPKDISNTLDYHIYGKKLFGYYFQDYFISFFYSPRSHFEVGCSRLPSDLINRQPLEDL